MKFSKIEVISLENISNEISNNPIITCFFCQKTKRINEKTLKLIECVTEKEESYCEFCARNKFYSDEINKDVLILSFKSLINYCFKQEHYKKEKMWKSQIQDLVDEHINLGLKLIVLYYDEESQNWFIDFSRIGTEQNQVNIEEIYNFVEKVVLCIFNAKNNFTFCDIDLFIKKYYDAIESFYQKRFRPKNKKVLCPTFEEKE